MKYSLFIGRFQPLHDGHIKLIQSVLDEGKSVCVALRETPISKENPFSTIERKEMFWREFKEFLEPHPPRFKIISIPDIEEVFYGRDVGWGIREIRLDSETEEISATKIRKKKKKEDPFPWMDKFL